MFFGYLFLMFMPFSEAKVKSRSKSHPVFGTPQTWKDDQLPTNIDIGKCFLLKQMEFNANSSVVVSNKEVATEVCIGNKVK